MSGTIYIDGLQRPLDEVRPAWLTKQVQDRRKAGEPVCVRVVIETGRLNLRLQSGDCPPVGGGGAGRQPNADERKVLDLWNKFGLGGSGFAPGKLVAFVKQLQNLL